MSQPLDLAALKADYSNWQKAIAERRVHTGDFILARLQPALLDAAPELIKAAEEADAMREALAFIREAIHEESLSEFSRLVAIGAILNSLEPLSPADIAKAQEIARAALERSK